MNDIENIYNTSDNAGIEYDIEMASRIEILNMMYDRVEALNDNIIACWIDNNITIVSKYGAELLPLTDVKNLNLCNKLIGTFKDDQLTVYSPVVNKTRTFKDVTKFNAIGEHFVAISSYPFTVINQNLDIIIEFGDSFTLNYYSAKNNIIKVPYTLDGKRCMALLNEASQQVEFYDSFEINDGYSLVAVDYNKSYIDQQKHKTINKDNLNKFKYNLYRYGTKLSNNKYDDVNKPIELSSTNTLYTYDNKYIGLIGSDGVELLKPIYSGVEYVGADNYLIYTDQDNIRYFALYNILKGTIYDFKDISNAYAHSTLPVVVIVLKNGEVKLVSTCDGSIYNAIDIAKHMNCKYSTENTNVIRVELDYGTKYITNRLVPINNIQEVSKLNNYNWIPM